MVVSLDIESPVGRVSVRTLTPPVSLRARPRSADLSAVVVSGDEESRRRIRNALVLAGWGDHHLPVDRPGLASVTGRHHQLVVVDLVHPLSTGDESALNAAATIARRPGTLLVTCGEADVPEHELWARCLAAFCHLAGAVSSLALVSVLEDARRVVERDTSSVTTSR